MIFSATELGGRRRCGWRWARESFNGLALTPLLPPTALDLGRMVHEAHARWEVSWRDAELGLPGAKRASLMLIFMDLEREATEHVRRKWLEAKGAPIPDEHLENLQRDVFDMGRGMCENYETFYSEPTPPGYVVIQPEQTFIADVPGTEHDREFSHKIKDWITCPHEAMDFVQDEEGAWIQVPASELAQLLEVREESPIEREQSRSWTHIAECNGLHQLECTLDSLIQDTSTGVVWVRERKTWDKHPTMDELMDNDQFASYGWMMAQEPIRAMIEAVSIMNVADIGGLAYDGMWKRILPSQARMIECAPGEAADAYGSLDRDDGSVPLKRVVYDSGTFLAKGRPFEDLFLRLPIPISRSRIEMQHELLYLQMMDFSTNPYLYPDRNWAGCWDCSKPMKELCHAYLHHESSDHLMENFTLRTLEHRRDIWPTPTPIQIKVS